MILSTRHHYLWYTKHLGSARSLQHPLVLLRKMAFHLQLRPPPLACPSFAVNAPVFTNKSIGMRNPRMLNCASAPNDKHKLVAEVKEKLEREFNNLPAGKNGRDDEELIMWFLKDRKFSVDDAVSKLTKAIRWYHAFGVSDLSEQSVRLVAESGKAYVHDYLDVYDRSVLIVEVSKHFPGVSLILPLLKVGKNQYMSMHIFLQKQDFSEDEKLCVFLVEKALSKLPAGKEQILGIIDLRGFGTENADIRFLTFLVILEPKNPFQLECIPLVDNIRWYQLKHMKISISFCAGLHSYQDDLKHIE